MREGCDPAALGLGLHELGGRAVVNRNAGAASHREQAGYVVASTVPDGDMTTANDAGSGSHDASLVCGTTIAPVL